MLAWVTDRHWSLLTGPLDGVLVVLMRTSVGFERVLLDDILSELLFILNIMGLGGIIEQFSRLLRLHS